MSGILPGDENTLLHTHPFNFNSQLEKTDLGKENPEPHSLRHGLRNGALYGSRTRIIPKNETDWRYLTPGDKRTWALCRNNKQNGHHTTTTQTTLTHLHQSQAYVLMYRKMEHSAGTENETPRDSIMASQQLPTEKLKPSHKTHHSEKEPLLHPDPPIKNPLE